MEGGGVENHRGGAAKRRQMDMRACACILRLILYEWCHATMNTGLSDWSAEVRREGGGDRRHYRDYRHSNQLQVQVTGLPLYREGPTRYKHVLFT